MTNINWQLFGFAIDNLLRFYQKNLFVFVVYTLLVMLLASLFFTQQSVRYEVEKITNNFPDIVIQNQKAMLYTTIDAQNVEKILDIDGVKDVQARVYGLYDFKQAKQSFLLIGIDPFETQQEPFLKEIVAHDTLKENSMVVSEALAKVMKNYYYEKDFNFLTPALKQKPLSIDGSFQSTDSSKRYSCVVLKEDAKEIFGYKENEYSDIAIYLSSQNELLTIVSKLQQLYPNAKITTKQDEQMRVESLFDYDSGIFISLFVISLFTFFMIVYDKAAGLSSSEKREIGILKALGWRVEDVLYVKFYEAGLLSFISYALGVVLALVYVYGFDAFYLKDIFLNILNLKEIEHLRMQIDFQPLFIVFLLSTPIYIAATLIPSWRVATMDADEVMR